jgi:sulfoquinovose isomerase
VDHRPHAARYAVAANMGRPGAYALVEHGINALNGPLRDKQHGGWYACVNDEGVIDASKQGYQHFFVLLGAASAVTTGHPQARKLLDDAIEVIERYFWSEEEQMCLESWDEAFSKTEDYRGGNANMHAVEAFLIVYDVTHDRKWLDRALRIASVIIHDVARRVSTALTSISTRTGTRSAITTSTILPTVSAPTAARQATGSSGAA